MKTELYLLRHGAAEDHGPDGSDSSRRLTSEGLTELRRVLALAKKAQVTPSLVLSSPLVRAVETAELVAAELGYQDAILKSRALAPDSSPQAVWEELRAHAAQPFILIAGHEPLLSDTIAWLLGSSRPLVRFPKAALARIDLARLGPAPSAILRWLITPGLLVP